MGTSSSSADLWPQDAVPRHWVATLFEKMTRMWGNRFLDAWRDVDLEGVMQEWGSGLKKLSNGELKAGVGALMTLKYPPSLPEFYALCKQMRLAEAQPNQALTDQTRATPAVVDANVARMRDMVKRAAAPKALTAEWAYQLLMRAQTASGGALSAEAVRCASDAISSKAGQAVIDSCIDADLKVEYQTIRAAVVESYSAAGKPLWGMK